jgi:hypothetical protein
MGRIISVTPKQQYWDSLPFVNDYATRDNISYHLQYLEFCYVVNFYFSPSLVTGSLLRKTIIIEYVSIIETILDNIISEFRVRDYPANSFLNLHYLRKTTRLGELLEIASWYKLLNEELLKKVGKIGEYRNRVHFKRVTRNEKELDYYTEYKLTETEAIFNEFIIECTKRYKRLCKNASTVNFIYPKDRAMGNRVLRES